MIIVHKGLLGTYYVEKKSFQLSQWTYLHREQKNLLHDILNIDYASHEISARKYQGKYRDKIKFAVRDIDVKLIGRHMSD